MLVILGAMVAFILFQLYNVLGRRIGYRPDEVAATAPEPVESEPVTLRLEARTDVIRPDKLESLKARDAQFNEFHFLEKALEVYEQVVLAFHKGELDPVRARLNPTVYDTFAAAIAARPKTEPAQSLRFVEVPKADFDTIDVRDDALSIRMRFLSELAYEAATTPETEGLDRPASQAETTFRRTAEYWTFEKTTKTPGASWILSKVEKALA